MQDRQRYGVYNKQNVTGVLISAQQRKHLVDNVINMRGLTDQSSPKKFTHIKTLGTKVENNRQREIDQQNQKLLNSIMTIMKRRNKSVIHARKVPDVLIGGKSVLETEKDSLMESSRFTGTNQQRSSPKRGQQNYKTDRDQVGKSDDEQDVQENQNLNEQSVNSILPPQKYNSRSDRYGKDLALKTVQNPIMMRGSLNVGMRRNELKRINNGNKKILDTLRLTKPAVGSIEEWRRHEDRSNSIKRTIRGMNLERKYNYGMPKTPAGAYQTTDGFSTKPPISGMNMMDQQIPFSQGSTRPPTHGKVYLPSLQIKGKNEKVQRFAETAGVGKRKVSIKRDTGTTPGSDRRHLVQGETTGSTTRPGTKRENSLDEILDTSQYRVNGSSVHQYSNFDRSFKQSRNSSINKRQYRTPLLSQINQYPSHILKRIMKDQARSVNYTYCQGLAQDDGEPVDSQQAQEEFIGRSHMIQNFNVETSDSSPRTNNPDRVWIQQTQIVPKVKFQEKPDVIQEHNDEQNYEEVSNLETPGTLQTVQVFDQAFGEEHEQDTPIKLPTSDRKAPPQTAPDKKFASKIQVSPHKYGDSKKTYATQETNQILENNIINAEVKSSDVSAPQSMQTTRTKTMKIAQEVEASQGTSTPFTIQTENKGDSKIFGKEQGGQSSQFSLSRTQIISPINEDHMLSSQHDDRTQINDQVSGVSGNTPEKAAKDSSNQYVNQLFKKVGVIEDDTSISQVTEIPTQKKQITKNQTILETNPQIIDREKQDKSDLTVQKRGTQKITVEPAVKKQ